MESDFVRVSGVFNMVSGVALLVYWYSFAAFLPYRELSTTLSLLVKSRNWTWINALGVIGALSGLLGQSGILLGQMDRAGWVGLIGYFVASVGTVLLIGTMLWETILWPVLVRHDASLLDFDGPIYKSSTFVPFFVVSALIYSAGYVLVGVEIVLAGVFPRLAGLLLAVGAPAFGLGALFGKGQVYPRSFGVTMMSAALVWLGIAMLLGGRSGFLP